MRSHTSACIQHLLLRLNNFKCKIIDNRVTLTSAVIYKYFIRFINNEGKLLKLCILKILILQMTNLSNAQPPTSFFSSSSALKNSTTTEPWLWYPKTTSVVNKSNYEKLISSVFAPFSSRGTSKWENAIPRILKTHSHHWPSPFSLTNNRLFSLVEIRKVAEFSCLEPGFGTLIKSHRVTFLRPITFCSKWLPVRRNLKWLVWWWWWIWRDSVSHTLWTYPGIMSSP